jgi:hypothetical protein
MTESRSGGNIIVAGLILTASMALYLLLDIAAAASLNPFISGGFALTALALSMFILDSLSVKQRLVLAGVLVSAVFAVRFVNWDSRKPFLRDFNQVQLGMTAEEVDQVMVGYIKYTSPFAATSFEGEVQMGAVSYQHTTEGWGDSDIGQITFAGGRVVATTFYPD